MKPFFLACIIAAAIALAVVKTYPPLGPELPPQAPQQAVADLSPPADSDRADSNRVDGNQADRDQANKDQASNDQASNDQASNDQSSDMASPDAAPAQQDLTLLADYAYSEVPPDTKPADTVLNALKDIPPGTPFDEVKRAAKAFGLDASFMEAVAKIESGFDPKQRTGSYIGLFQLSNYEFDKYGAGDITDSRDNAVAAAYKFITAAILFEIATHKKPTLSDLYLIHQQGTQGAAEHVSHPERIAWKSMCATDEGRLKGEKWCKRAIWQNTLPAIKQIWKTVDNLTSGAFVAMWRERVDLFYANYSQAIADK